MPKLRLTDAHGTIAQLDTLDPAKIGPWIAEWLPRLTDNTDRYPGPLLLYVVPLWDPATDRLDWPPDIETIPLGDRPGREQLLAALAEILWLPPPARAS